MYDQLYEAWVGEGLTGKSLRSPLGFWVASGPASGLRAGGHKNERMTACGAKCSPNHLPKPGDMIGQAFQICVSLPLPGPLAFPQISPRRLLSLRAAGGSQRGGVRSPAQQLHIQGFFVEDKPAIAQLAEHLTVECAAIRWSLVRFRVAGFYYQAQSP